MTRSGRSSYAPGVSVRPTLVDVRELSAHSESIGGPMLRTWVEAFSSKVISGVDDEDTGVMESSMPATPRESWIRKAVVIVVAQPRNQCCRDSDRMTRRECLLQDV